ncbi:MAG: LUD domain-containing protein [Conexivisphaera sp.]|jgi:L-lactate dehydrogenase complex protein LldG
MCADFLDLKKEAYRWTSDERARTGMERACASFQASRRLLEGNAYVDSLARDVRDVKSRTLQALDELVSQARENMERNGIHVVLARTKDDALAAVGDIVGTGKLVVKSKSIVTEELGLREYLGSRGNEVWETDLGEFLLQISGKRPAHFVAVSMHLPREEVLELLRSKLKYDGPSDIPSMVGAVREFLRDRILRADVGIIGANAVAAADGSIVQVENEGNARLTGTVPPLNIAVTGIDKVVPTLVDAFKVALLESYEVGGTPPTYVNVTSGPSGTRDVEHALVRPAQGAKEMHVVLVDNGRSSAIGTPLEEVLRCIRCGSCQLACPVLTTVGPAWSSGAYMGGIGVLWTAVTMGPEAALPLTYLCGECRVCEDYCPMGIRVGELVGELKRGLEGKLEV